MSRSQSNLAAHKAGVVRAYTNEDTDTGGGRPKTPVNLLAVEANETIIVEQEKVVKFADDNNIVIMAV